MGEALFPGLSQRELSMPCCTPLEHSPDLSCTIVLLAVCCYQLFLCCPRVKSCHRDFTGENPVTPGLKAGEAIIWAYGHL